MRILFITTIFILFLQNLSAQKVGEKGFKFSNAPVQFQSELEEVLTYNKKTRDAGEIIYTDFTAQWNGSYFSDEDKQKIIKAAIYFYQKQSIERALNGFAPYLKALTSFAAQNHSKQSFDVWFAFLEELMKKRRPITHLIYFTEIGYRLFDNILIEYKTVKWTTTSTQFTFEKEDKDLYVVLNATDLTCFANRDSSKIENTSGKMNIMEKTWTGKNGKVTWERANFDPAKVYAKLNNYEIKLLRAEYEADNVQFYQLDYLTTPLTGKLTERVKNAVSPDKAIYPRFEATGEFVFLKNILDGIDFMGAFSQRGAMFVGAGNETRKAQVNVFKDDSVVVKVKSNAFVFKENEIKAINAEVIVPIQTDSIYHPGLVFNYINKDNKKKVILIRDSQDRTGLGVCPYYNSYNDMTMDFEVFYWNLDSGKYHFTLIGGTKNIDMPEATATSGLANRNVTFRSNSYFSLNEWDKLQLMNKTHPLIILRNYKKKYETDRFTTSELAKVMQIGEHSAHLLLIQLTAEGFIEYDILNKTGRIKQKTFDYIEYRKGTKDYDQISIISNKYARPTEEQIAQFDIEKKELDFFGIDSIEISPGRDVKIRPESQKITLEQNGNFYFDGKIQSGVVTCEGNNFYFDKKNYKIVMDEIPHFKMAVKEPIDSSGQLMRTKEIKSSISGTNAVLYLDNPKNKSGSMNDSFPEYPIFEMNDSSFIYYDDKFTQKIKYPREDFYIKLAPFKIDSLENFTTNSLAIEGLFISGGILKPFSPKIEIIADSIDKINYDNITGGFSTEKDIEYSLGFHIKDPKKYELYGNRGIGEYELILSNQALRGKKGSLKYLSSKAYSQTLFHNIDSMYAKADTFIIIGQKGSDIEFPDTKIFNTLVIWHPYDNSLTTSQTNNPIELYKKRAILIGEVQIEPDGLYGKGNLKIDSANIKSPDFAFKYLAFKADSANFKVSYNKDTIFQSENLTATIDLEVNQGIFNSNQGSLVNFPKNNYACRMSQFIWNIDSSRVTLSQTNSTDEFIRLIPTGNVPELDAVKADFVFEHQSIIAQDIDYIKVADAIVYPSDDVLIKQEGTIPEIHKAQLLVAMKHKIYNADVKIVNKNEYLAAGEYWYKPANTDSTQKIYFEEITVDNDKKSYASTKLKKEDGFKISPEYAGFEGKIEILPNEKHLKFEGETQIINQCGADFADAGKIEFENTINPNDILLQDKSMSKTADNQEEAIIKKKQVGFFMTDDTTDVYACFFTKKKNNNDIAILTVPDSSFLYFDNENKRYKVSSIKKKKDINNEILENYLDFHNDSCIILGSGEINLLIDFQKIDYTATGFIKHSIDNSYTEYNLILPFDFNISKYALDLMADLILTDINLTNVPFREGYQRLLQRTENSIVFTNTTFQWEAKKQKYQSIGKIGVRNIMNIPVNKMVDGYIEITNAIGADDEIEIYIEINKDTWFYFYYFEGIMQALSSETDFNDAVKENTDMTKRKNALNEIELANPIIKNNFVKRYNSLK